MPKFILLNGPPRAGKDTAALYIVNALRHAGRSAYEDKLSAPLKFGFSAIVGAEMDGFNVVGFESTKEQRLDTFGVSFRQFQIDMSEKFMKPLYGQDIFSKLLIARAGDRLDEFCVVSDCGFQSEFNYLSRHAECWLVSIHREGASFHGDSRQWVQGEPMKIVSVVNNGSLIEFEHKLQKALYSLKIVGE